VISVLDASAVLALIFAEPGADAVADAIAAGAVISAVNLAEVATVLVRRGRRDPEVVLAPVTAQVAVEPFADLDWPAVARLYPLVSAKGLSFGDRACLALAQRLSVTALTAERVWVGLPHGVSVRDVRPG